MFFPACHWSFCTFSTSGENLLPLVPAENFAFVSTLWIPAEDPSLTAAGTFSLSGPFSNGLCLVGGRDFIPCFSGILKNSKISCLDLVSKKTRIIPDKSRSAVRPSLCSNSLKCIAATLDAGPYRFYSFTPGFFMQSELNVQKRSR